MYNVNERSCERYMKILLIEPTPSPNSMKLQLDEVLDSGIRKTYTLENIRSAPPWIAQILEIDGVRSVFHTADFIAIDRRGGADWGAILAQIQQQFQQQEIDSSWNPEDQNEFAFGEAQVLVQYFRGIPMQIRVKAGQKEERISLAARFVNAVTEVASATLIKERKLTDYGVRYGELPEIAREVEQELEAAYPEERLQTIVKQAIAHGRSETEFVEQRKSYTLAEIEQLFSHEEWQQRYAALDALEPSEATMPLILKVIHDPKLQIRRLAVVYLGDIGSTEAISRLCEALQDSSPVIRRTAGDTLSDLGDPVATKSMIEALQDKSKLVRWRAARFLFDVGDERCVPALRDAIDDTEFEVSLQARMALERIEAGEEAVGTVWQQMANRER
jgi:hypothetical protein